MVKVYKSKTSSSKLLLYLPYDVITALGVKDGDDIDFIKYNDRAFLFAKKSDIATLLLAGGTREEPKTPKEAKQENRGISEDEIRVLKKMDTLKYADRTPENVGKLLNDAEKEQLQSILKKKAVALFESQKTGKRVYSIPKDVYERFLMRKQMASQRPQVPAARQSASAAPRYQPAAPLENEGVKTLEEKGFVVLQSESEASGVSLALEDSIRHGQVIGTRAFNKKFYIVLRRYLSDNGPRVLKGLANGQAKVADLAKELKLDEDGVRAVLYLLSEGGEVSEKRKDIFALA